MLFVFFGKMLAAESLDTEVGITSFFLSTEPTCNAGLEVKKMDIGCDQKVGQKTNLVEPPSLRGLIFGLLVVSLLGAFPKDACLREIVEQKLVYFLPQPILPMMG